MPVKIRLARHGKKARPFYHIVVADGRAPRDGKYIEKIGTYDPITKPAEIVLDFEKALSWLQKGAQPTNTCRSILSYKGVMIKNHLLKGVQKGALTEDQAEERLKTWLDEKNTKIGAIKEEEIEKKQKTRTDKFEIESKIREEKEAELKKKRSDLIEKKVEREEQVEKTLAEEAQEKAKAEEVPEVKAEPDVKKEPEVKSETKAEEVPEVKAEEKTKENPEKKSGEKQE